jgi:SAM-dependent methyltransferase
MSDPEDCAICAHRGALPDALADLDASMVTAPAEVDSVEYACVVARSHVVEPFDLPGLQRRRYWEEVLRVARALRDVSGATNIDYEIHRGAALHLRTHIFARKPTRPATRAALRDAIEAGSPSGAASTADVVAVYDDMSTGFEQQLANGFYNVHYDRPAVLDLCGDVRGLHVLELGCGPGFYLAELRERGAEVVGVDASAELLALARARLGEAVELHEHNLEHPLTMFADRSFDGVVMALVYHHIDDRDALLREVGRVLRPGGWFVLSTSHPVSDWLASGGSYFTVERTEGVFALGGAGTWHVPFWRMPMGVLLDEILGAELVLERLVEPVPPADREAVDPRLHRRLLLEPGFVALRARRPA